MCRMWCSVLAPLLVRALCAKCGHANIAAAVLELEHHPCVPCGRPLGAGGRGHSATLASGGKVALQRASPRSQHFLRSDLAKGKASIPCCWRNSCNVSAIMREVAAKLETCGDRQLGRRCGDRLRRGSVGCPSNDTRSEGVGRGLWPHPPNERAAARKVAGAERGLRPRPPGTQAHEDRHVVTDISSRSAPHGAKPECPSHCE